MIARYTASFSSAAIVTFGLLLLMQVLISTGTATYSESAVLRFVDFVRVERPPHIETTREPLEPFPESDTPPPRPKLEPGEGEGISVTIKDPTPPSVRSVGPRGYSIVDGAAMAIVQVVPHYPRSAIVQGLEGYAIVEFTVSRTGTVADAIVLESSHRFFEKPALDAVYKFKYRPRVINGEAIEMHGVRYRFTFELDRN